LAHVQPGNRQNVQKLHFWQKAPEFNGLTEFESDICQSHENTMDGMAIFPLIGQKP